MALLNFNVYICVKIKVNPNKFGFLQYCSPNAPSCYNTIPHNTFLYRTTYGASDKPIIPIRIPIPAVTKELNIHIGKIDMAITVLLPKMVILCIVPQLSHLIGLYVHQNDLKILLQLNFKLQFSHFCTLSLP
jgi:hypothetical protein